MHAASCARLKDPAFSLVPAHGNGLKSAMAQTDPLSPAHPLPANGPDGSFDMLLQRVGQHRDRTAFIALFHHFAPRLKSFLMKNGTPPDQAEELMQDTMLSVWARAESYNPALSRASTWIFTIARNKKIDSLRKSTRAEYDAGDPAYIQDHDTPTLDEAVMQSSRTRRIADVLQTLPPEQSALLRKSFFEDKTHMEIAAETQLPLGTVKSRIRLALERLRGQLGEEYL